MGQRALSLWCPVLFPNSTLAFHFVGKQLLEAVTDGELPHTVRCVTGTRGACVGQHGWQVARWQPAAPPWWG